jgi:Zn-dependent membrane protease YugP
MFFYIDPTYFLWVALPTLILSLGVQMYLKSTFAKWSKVPNKVGATGMLTTQALFDRTSLDPIPVERVSGQLSDHYDPRANVVRLSQPVADVKSVAAMAVSAHELGHVQQYQTGSGLIKMRGMLLPALQFSPTLSYICLMLGFLFNMTGFLWLGIFFFGLMVVFSLLTLPVEFDASRRGLKMLDEAGMLTSPEDKQGAQQVLRAAGLTYLAAAVTSVLQLLYYVSIVNRQRRHT